MAKVGDIVVLVLNGAEQDVKVTSVHERNGTINVEGVSSRVAFQTVPKESKDGESIRYWRPKGKDEPENYRGAGAAVTVPDAPIVVDRVGDAAKK